MKEGNEKRNISSTHKKELTIPNQQQKSKFFWLSLICLWSIWSLPKLNTNRYGNCFDQFHFELQPKGEKINNLENFFIFAKRPESLLKYELALPRMILSSFHCNFKVCFSKATMSWRLIFFSSVDKFRCKCDRHEKFYCDKKVKPFCFLQKYCL